MAGQVDNHPSECANDLVEVQENSSAGRSTRNNEEGREHRVTPAQIVAPAGTENRVDLVFGTCAQVSFPSSEHETDLLPGAPVTEHLNLQVAARD
jgi:hypothetical protein